MVTTRWPAMIRLSDDGRSPSAGVEIHQRSQVKGDAEPSSGDMKKLSTTEYCALVAPTERGQRRQHHAEHRSRQSQAVRRHGGSVASGRVEELLVPAERKPVGRNFSERFSVKVINFDFTGVTMISGEQHNAANDQRV